MSFHKKAAAAIASNGIQFLKQELDEQEVLSFYNQIKQLDKTNDLLLTNAFFIVDYRRMRYMLMQGKVENVVGFHAQDFLQGGLNFFFDLLCKEDGNIFTTKCTPGIHALLKNIPHQEHEKIVVELNYRVKTTSHGIVSVLQKGRYITDKETNEPTYFLGTCCDISPYKKDSSIVQVIKKRIEGHIETIATNYFYPDPTEQVLTKKEKEILLWLAEGLSTKQIAAKVNAAQNTVANHRKNMLRKTNAKSTAQLIRVGFTHHML